MTAERRGEHRTPLPVVDREGRPPTDCPGHRGHGGAHDGDPDRRVFLARVTFGLAGFSAFLVSVPVVGSLVAPFLKRVPSPWRQVGPLSQFVVGETVLVQFEDPSSLPWAGVTARSAAWLRRTSQTEFIAFAINCRHLGCPVRWVPDAELFMCPCHGGVYYADGTVAAGPPPEPLSRYPVRIRDGAVELQAQPMPLTTTATSPATTPATTPAAKPGMTPPSSA